MKARAMELRLRLFPELQLNEQHPTHEEKKAEDRLPSAHTWFQTNHSDKVRVPVLRPIAAVILILLSISLVSVYLLQRDREDDQVAEQIQAAGLLLNGCLDQDARRLHGYATLLSQDVRLQQWWKVKDRERLYEAAKPDFDDLLSDQGITHFYFHDVNQVCFLRVHQPNRHGDVIKRATLAQTATTGQPSEGVELGPLATLTLRVVIPWRIEGQLAGYIELGEEIGHIIPMVRRVLNVESILTLDKAFVTRSGWEEGMRMLGRKPDWNLSPHVVVVDQTVNEIVIRRLASTMVLQGDDPNRQLRFHVGGTTYKGGVCPLLDAHHRHIGDFILLKNVTALERASLLLYGLLIFGAVAIGGSLTAGFRWYVKRIERELTMASRELKNEIQKRKLTEQELSAYQGQLENIVSQRTIQLETANRQLAQEVTQHVKTQEALDLLNKDLESAIKKVRMSNRDLQDMVRAAAHDLKSPVRSIGMLVEWIRQDCTGNLSPTGLGNLDLLAHRVQRLDRHLSRIVEYATIRPVSNPTEPIDLKTLLHEMLAELSVPPHVQVRIEGDLPLLAMGHTHARQLFGSLLDNAIRYADKPESLVRIGCVEETDFWRFTISDNGPGIAEKYHQKIFEMFQTLAPRDAVETTGMGLTIAKRIVEIYGGEIGLESVPGQGSTFFFTLARKLIAPRRSESPSS
jgi:signal transduction histidine kinase